MSQVRVRIRVEGRVQGVWFRASTRKVARQLGIVGFVRNLPDGSVEVVAEGTEDAVTRLCGWCRTGPPNAMVLNVHEETEPWRGEFDTFEVSY